MNSELKKLIEDFLFNSQIMGSLNSDSVIKYRKQLSRLFEEARINSISEITSDKIKEFIMFKRKNKVKSITIRGYLYPLKGLLKFIKEEKGLSLKVDLDRIPIPVDKEIREVVFLNKEEIEKFIEAIVQNTKNISRVSTIRFLALVYFLLETGARISEALSIKIEDVDWEGCQVEIVGKGNKKRTLFFRNKTKYWLKEYLKFRRDDCEYLFVILNGKSVWKHTEIDGLFRKYKDLAGIKKQVSAHVMRHTFCTQLLFEGVPLNIVSRLAGHSSTITTLKHYAGVMEIMEANKILKDEHFNFIPEAEIVSAKL
jgi:integrase/recombinase XerD